MEWSLKYSALQFTWFIGTLGSDIYRPLPSKFWTVTILWWCAAQRFVWVDRRITVRIWQCDLSCISFVPSVMWCWLGCQAILYRSKVLTVEAFVFVLSHSKRSLFCGCIHLQRDSTCSVFLWSIESTDANGVSYRRVADTFLVNIANWATLLHGSHPWNLVWIVCQANWSNEPSVVNTIWICHAQEEWHCDQCDQSAYIFNKPNADYFLCKCRSSKHIFVAICVCRA